MALLFNMLRPPGDPGFCLLVPSHAQRPHLRRRGSKCTPNTPEYSLFLAPVLLTRYSLRLQLWCWIASQWNALRIYSYYLPIWICSVLSAVIYFAVGYHVFHQRNQLRNLSLSNQGIEVTGETSDVRDSAEKVCYLCLLAYCCSRLLSPSSVGPMLHRFVGCTAFPILSEGPLPLPGGAS